MQINRRLFFFLHIQNTTNHFFCIYSQNALLKIFFPCIREKLQKYYSKQQQETSITVTTSRQRDRSAMILIGKFIAPFQSKTKILLFFIFRVFLCVFFFVHSLRRFSLIFFSEKTCKKFFLLQIFTKLNFFFFCRRYFESWSRKVYHAAAQ